MKKKKSREPFSSIPVAGAMVAIIMIHCRFATIPPRIVLVLIVGLLFLSGTCPAREVLTPEEKAWLAEKETLTFVSQSRYAPFEFVGEDGNVDGMSVELLRWIAAEFGFKATFDTMSFKEAQSAVLNGDVDVITSLFYSEKRDEKFDFTEAFFEVPALIFVNANRYDINGIASLSGKRIAMQKGDYAAEFLASKGIDYTLLETEDFSSATRLLVNGEADAVIGDRQIVYYAIFTNDWADRLKTVGEPLYVGRNGMATKDGESMLISILDKGLANAKEHGLWDRTSAKWMGVSTASTAGDYFSRHKKGIIAIGIAIILVVAIGSLWTLHLQRTVKIRTQDLVDRETWLTTLLDAMNDALLVVELDRGAIVDANKRFEELFGYTRDEVRRLDLTELCGEEVEGVHERNMSLLVLAGKGQPQVVETIMLAKGGRRFWCEASLRGAHLGGSDTVLLLIRDISVRKKSEQELLVREKDFQALTENSPDLICRFDTNKRFLYVNYAVSLATDITTTEFVGKTVSELGFPAEDFVRWNRSFDELLETGRIVETEFVLIKDGRTVFYNDRLVPEFNAEGELLTILSVARDITRLKLAEQELEAIQANLEIRVDERTAELRKLERQQKAILNNITDMAWLKDCDGRFIAVNEAVSKACGQPAEQIVGRTDFDFWPRDLCERYRRDDLEVMGTRQMVRTEEPFQQHTDRVRWLETIKLPVIDAEGKVIGTTGIARDITHRKEFEQVLQRSNIDLEEIVQTRTHELERANAHLKNEIVQRERAEEERRRMELQVQQSQKLESLGVMAGGIAHDFNNLLMGILGNIDLAGMEIGSDSPAAPLLAEAEIASRRAADLCRQMLAYSGRGKFMIEAVNLNSVIMEMANLLRLSISTRATLRFALMENIPCVEGDITQLRQVVMNLITNAAEAIQGDGGGIVLSTGVIDCDREYLEKTWLNDELPPGRYVYFQVEDSGSGMDRETLEHIFEPFFTTKFAGRGLGLAAVLGIVRSHNGAVEISSEEGVGTRFKVLMPETENQPDGGPTTTGSENGDAAAINHCGTILLADDEEPVRVVGQKMLERAGYKVITACDGVEALEQFHVHRHEIVAIILDLMMPRMDGETAFRKLREIDPSVRVVLSSGYGEQEILERFNASSLVGFLQKPYKSAELLSTLQKATRNDNA